MKDLYKLPDDLPIPINDGACDHLLGSRIPSVTLMGTSDTSIDPGSVEGTVVIFFYPMIGRPNSPPMTGWNDIPGARGCTPQSCSFRDNHSRLEKLGVKVFGISSQPLIDQKEASARLKLPFELLNDSQLELTKAMNLPTFEYDSATYNKRITIISEDGVIKKIFYPIFPPDKNASDVIEWVEHNFASIQLVRKGRKQQAGMPKKSKHGSKEKQQSKAQRAFNAFQSYRSDFFADNGVTVGHVTQFLKEGNKLHGHGSGEGSKDSGENPATTEDANVFVGWYRKNFLSD